MRLTNFFKLFIFFLIFTAIFIVSFIWIFQEIWKFNKQSEIQREEYIKSHKELIKGETLNAYNYIEYKKNEIDNTLKKDIKNRVNEAYAVMMNIYNKNRNKKSDYEIKEMIKNALRPVKFNNKRGYYFITDLNGYSILHAEQPNMEGRNTINMTDSNGKYIIKDFIKIIKQKNEGYYQYKWTKPNTEGNIYNKISYIKLFEPYNWFIGTGEYIEDVEADIKRQIIDRLDQIRYKGDNYIFIGQYNGYAIGGPNKNQMLIDIQDDNGVMIVQELIKLAKSGGGFLEYDLPLENNRRKLSYTIGVDDWQWYVGTGMYIDEIDKIIEKNRKKLFNSIILQIIYIIIIFFVIVFGVMIITEIFIRKYLNKELNLFSDFFQQTVPLNKKIESVNIKIKELKDLAFFANQMIDNKNEIENTLKESENRFEKIIEASPDGIALVDMNGNYIECNSALYKMLGFKSRKNFLKNNAMDFIDNSEREEAAKNLMNTIKKGYTKSEEYTLVKKNKSKIIGEVSAAVIKNQDGKPVSIVSILKDITDRKNIEKEKERMFVELEKKQEELERFTYTVSHDLRSPLITIKGFLGLIKDDFSEKNSENFFNDAEEISKAVNTMNSLLNDLLELSRIGRINYMHEKINLKSLINDSIDLVKGQINNKNAEIIIQDNMPDIYIDKKRFLEVFQNLIENAIKYSQNHHQPKIEIGLKKDKNNLIIFIKDNGIGIEEKYHEKIFGLFDKLDPNSEGTGIGLALVKRIILNHNGKIWVESDGKNTGSSFFISIPKKKNYVKNRKN